MANSKSIRPPRKRQKRTRKKYPKCSVHACHKSGRWDGLCGSHYGERLPFKEFSSVGPSPTAREQRKAIRLSFKARHPKYSCIKHRRKKFGLSPEAFEQMKAAQHNLCAICGHPEESYRNGVLKELAVDHDWKTGAIRALLCSRCNTGIGLFREDARLIEAALSYLNAHNPLGLRDSRILNAEKVA